jgi:hypothetical protein
LDSVGLVFVGEDVDVEGGTAGVYSDDDVAVAGGEVVGFFVGDVVGFIDEGGEDVAGSGVDGFGEQDVEGVDGGVS